MALVNECLPLHEPSARITATAGAAITGKKFVFISAAAGSDLKPVVNQSGAATKSFGVAAYDVASGADVVVLRGRRILPVTAAGAIAAGAEVEADSTGAAVTKASGIGLGRAITVGVAAADVYIDVY